MWRYHPQRNKHRKENDCTHWCEMPGGVPDYLSALIFNFLAGTQGARQAPVLPVHGQSSARRSGGSSGGSGPSESMGGTVPIGLTSVTSAPRSPVSSRGWPLLG